MLCFCCDAQPQLSPDSVALQNAIHFFYNKINAAAHLYTGKEYYRYEPGIKGFPFYINNKPQNGDIFYDGTLYKNIPMMFDAVRQVIVIDDYNKQNKIQLLTEKIRYFTMGSHLFETVSQTEETANTVSKNLYDVMYKGRASVMIKRIKKIKKGLRPEDPYAFEEEDEYYIKRDKNLYLINNKNAVIDALGDKKNEVKSFIKKNKLRFKKHIEQDVMQAAVFYSSLN